MKATLKNAKEIIAKVSEKDFLHFLKSSLQSMELVLERKVSRRPKAIAVSPRIPKRKSRLK